MPDYPYYDPQTTSCLFQSLKTANFRFKPEVRGRILKLMVSLDSACLITLISTLQLLLICLKPLKPIISGLNRKCVGGSQNGHQNRSVSSLNPRKVSKYPLLFLKTPKTGFFYEKPAISCHFRSSVIVETRSMPTVNRSFVHYLYPGFRL